MPPPPGARARHPERLHDHQAARLQPELRHDLRRGRRASTRRSCRRRPSRCAPEAESHGPIRYLINTEHHVDHIFGNYWFQGAGDGRQPPGRCTTTSWTRTRSSTRSPTPSRPSRPTIPTAAPILPDRDDYYADPQQGHDRVHRRPDAAGRRPHVPPAPHAGPHARPARRPRPGGARRLHRRHDLLRVPDLADDLERRPVARGARADPRRSTSTTSCPGHGPVVRRSSTWRPSGRAAGVEGRGRRRRRQGLVTRGDRSRGSGSTTRSARSTSGRDT